MKVIVYNRNSDGRCIYKIPATKQGELEVKADPECDEYWIVDQNIFVHDDSFRDAWEYNSQSNAIEINLEKAKLIHISNLDLAITIESKRILKESGLLYYNTLGTPLPKDVQVKVQKYIDLKDSIDLSQITNLDDLKETWPEEFSYNPYG